jgi:hypothetical protein
MNKLSYIILLTLLSCGQTKPPNDHNKERIDAICDKFMQTFRAGNLSDAMQLLKDNSIIANSTIDTLQATINEQMKTILSSYGKIRSYEFVAEHKIKNTIAKRFYILKLDQYYLKFVFILYNNGADWTITSFNYNEELDELLN